MQCPQYDAKSFVIDFAAPSTATVLNLDMVRRFAAELARCPEAVRAEPVLHNRRRQAEPAGAILVRFGDSVWDVSPQTARCAVRYVETVLRDFPLGRALIWANCLAVQSACIQAELSVICRRFAA